MRSAEKEEGIIIIIFKLFSKALCVCLILVCNIYDIPFAFLFFTII